MQTSHSDIHFWQLQEAKAKLSELVRIVVCDGPQGISVHGNEEVIMLSVENYDALIKPKQNFWQFMSNSPLAGTNIKVVRDQSPDRDIEL